jgi:hypothetical protein
MRASLSQRKTVPLSFSWLRGRRWRNGARSATRDSLGGTTLALEMTLAARQQRLSLPSILRVRRLQRICPRGHAQNVTKIKWQKRWISQHTAFCLPPHPPPFANIPPPALGAATKAEGVEGGPSTAAARTTLRLTPGSRV